MGLPDAYGSTAIPKRQATLIAHDKLTAAMVSCGGCGAFHAAEVVARGTSSPAASQWKNESANGNRIRCMPYQPVPAYSKWLTFQELNRTAVMGGIRVSRCGGTTMAQQSHISEFFILV
jgi:hypothetical protein